VAVSVGLWNTADPYPFVDVAAGNAHRHAIACLAERGIVRGFGNQIYKPAISVSRQQVGNLVARSLGLETPAGGLAALLGAGYDLGHDGAHPQQPASRAEVAALLASVADLAPLGGGGFSDTAGTSLPRRDRRAGRRGHRARVPGRDLPT
jgi:hypothetical protein